MLKIHNHISKVKFGNTHLAPADYLIMYLANEIVPTDTQVEVELIDYDAEIAKLIEKKAKLDNYLARIRI